MDGRNGIIESDLTPAKSFRSYLGEWIIPLIISLGIFLSCAKKGQILIKMPKLPDPKPEIKEDSSCEIMLKKKDSEMESLRAELWDYKWGELSIHHMEKYKLLDEEFYAD